MWVKVLVGAPTPESSRGECLHAPLGFLKFTALTYQSNIPKMKEQLNDKELIDILNNKDTEVFYADNAFQKYIELDFEVDKALSLACLTDNDIHRNPLLR